MGDSLGVATSEKFRIFNTQIQSSMWCPDCEQEFRPVPDADVQICPRCQAAARAGRRQRRVPSLEAPGSSSTTIVRIDHAHERKLADSAAVTGEAPPPLTSIQSTGFPTTAVSHRVYFGLFVFFVGEVVLIWADLVGHALAIRAGHFVATMGLALAFVTVAGALRQIEYRLKELTMRRGRTLAKKSRRHSQNSSRANR